ncbi:MAG: aminotransferase class V-fold PLP-dependent enzyme, partial [Candidatus Omnitrophica bacterium]|nr:aminotransferase class V-fold PLP-dependent enzyme [Candidatus Omnitrophota bacterium]
AGYKWLCGPYATGFCWIRPEVRQRLQYNHAYWQAVLNESQLNSVEPISDFELTSARHYDMFATANFFNYLPWHASVTYFEKLGMEKVAQYNQQLVGMIIDGVDKSHFSFISPTEPDQRTNLVVLTCQNPEQNEAVFNRLKEAGIFGAFWKGNIRVSPHIHNTRNEIDRFIRVINSFFAEPKVSA